MADWSVNNPKGNLKSHVMNRAEIQHPNWNTLMLVICSPLGTFKFPKVSFSCFYHYIFYSKGLFIPHYLMD
jgi:hypothetical protein